MTRPTTRQPETRDPSQEQKVGSALQNCGGGSPTRRSLNVPRLISFPPHKSYHLISMYTSFCLFGSSRSTPRYNIRNTSFSLPTPTVKQTASDRSTFSTRGQAVGKLLWRPVQQHTNHAPFCASARRSCSSISVTSQG